VKGLVIHVEGDHASDWVLPFAEHLPDWDVRWSDGFAQEDADCVEAAVVWQPPAGFLGHFHNLRTIVSVSAGLDHLKGDPSCPTNVRLIRRMDPLSTRAMAEFVLMQVLMQHRLLVTFFAERARRVWAPRAVGPLSSRRVGVLGLGPMGLASAELLQAMGCSVTAWSRSSKDDAPVPFVCGFERLDAFLGSVDTLVNLLPSRPETCNLLSEARLSLLPVGSTIVNVGRGDVLDQRALLRLLDSGHLAAAALDVLPQEPPSPSDPVWEHPKIILTPHVASLPDPAAFGAWVATTL
jgi:glyoxylate/hydroxypyruvate reductase